MDEELAEDVLTVEKFNFAIKMNQRLLEELYVVWNIINLPNSFVTQVTVLPWPGER